MKATIIEAIPSWAASYIANNDPTNLEEKDVELVDNFIRKLKCKGLYIICPTNNTEYFTNHPAFGLPCMANDWCALPLD